METIYNLIIFGVVIGLLFLTLNNLQFNKDEPFKTNISKFETDNEFFKSEKGIFPDIPKGNLLNTFDYAFDYESVPENKEKFNLSKKFYNELDHGATVRPRYEPPKGFEKNKFYTHKLEDQKIIHDNRLYEKPIHRYRTLEVNDKDTLPTKISEIFNESITDFKSLVPLKKGIMGDFVTEGGSNQSAYTPDFMNYENEKPENGGIIPNLYGAVYGNDTMIQSGAAVF
jgi:hypothetical protein